MTAQEWLEYRFFLYKTEMKILIIIISIAILFFVGLLVASLLQKYKAQRIDRYMESIGYKLVGDFYYKNEKE